MASSAQAQSGSPEYYSGRVHSIIFENEAEAFYILRFTLDEGGTTTVRGKIPGLTIRVGTWVGFEGKWTRHPKFGDQVMITRAPVVQRWDGVTTSRVLASWGVGPMVCSRLEREFGDHLEETLNADDPSVLTTVKGVTEFTANHILSRWKAARSQFRALEFLGEAGVPKGLVSQVWTMFGENAEEILTKDPWRLVQVGGIRFDQVDEVATRLGLELGTNPLRVRGAVYHATRARRSGGHLYLSIQDLLNSVGEHIAGLTPEMVAAGISDLHKEGLVHLDRQTRPGTTAIYEPWLYTVEQNSAEMLIERMKVAAYTPGEVEADEYMGCLAETGNSAQAARDAGGDLVEVAHAALEEWGRGSKLTLTETQFEGALNALTEPVSIITGLPGTGKSTLLKGVVRVLQDADVKFLLIAPTGIAAKRMSALTGASASTIHRAFQAKGWGSREREATYVGVVGDSDQHKSSDGRFEDWGSEDDQNGASVVICDEASMVDQHLLYRILTCTGPKTRLVFVGDAAQLPSVGPGNVLRDMIASGLFPMVALTEIFRQEGTSDIVMAAHAVHDGRVPNIGATGSDFRLLETQTEEQVLSLVLQLAQRLYDKRRRFQVMSPRHKGTVGVTNLNIRLREMLNPKQPGLQEMRLGSETIREDDRIMVVRNHYGLGVFNGDTGKVVRIDRKARVVEIKIHGPPVQHVQVPFKDVPSYLRLAYAVTVHKMQGQEAEVVVMPIVTGFQWQLQRNLLYTAMTRGKSKVILVGHYQALVRAVENNRQDNRNTLFLDRLHRVFNAA